VFFLCRTLTRRAEPATAVRAKDEALECMAPADEDFDYADTFLSAEHAVSSFDTSIVDVYMCCDSSYKASKGAVSVTVTLADGESVSAIRIPGSADVAGACASLPGPPYRVSLWRDVNITDTEATADAPAAAPAATKKRKAAKKGKNESPASATEGAASAATVSRDIVLIRPYKAASTGPYPEDRPPRNRVPFTTAQVEAIRSGMNKVRTCDLVACCVVFSCVVCVHVKFQLAMIIKRLSLSYKWLHYDDNRRVTFQTLSEHTELVCMVLCCVVWIYLPVRDDYKKIIPVIQVVAL
jgi:hypothetical protein